MTGHLSETSVCELVDGALAESDKASATAHLDACSDCRRLLSAALLSASRPREVTVDGAPAPRVEPGAEVGRYQITALLGQGAMGQVYAAVDRRLDRKVALKAMRGPRSNLVGLLWAEARSLAQVSHRNVVAVHDVLSIDGQAYLAVEHLDGVPLSSWLEERRSLAELLDVFLQAGEGLAAAHRANVVHQDFKPSNVMVCTDGRVCVIDFGLAALASSQPDHPAAAAGTPAYMAPEQRTTGQGTPRSDQYAFCVSLQEALLGHRQAMPARARTGDAAFLRLPRRVRQVLARGLSAAPEDRFPSMEALLEELRPRPRGRAAWLGAGVAVAVAVVLGAIALVARPRARCSSGPQELAGVWDEARRSELQRGFSSSGLSFAGEAFQRLSPALDAYARDWLAMHAEVCGAPASTPLVEPRLFCLDRRRIELRALTERLRVPDRQWVERAPALVASLSPIGDCAQGGWLELPAARGPSAKAVQALARAKVLRLEGEYSQGMRAAQDAVAKARAERDAPTEAEALMVVAQNLEGAHQWREAAAAWEQAIVSATGAGSAALQARAIVGLSYHRVEGAEQATTTALQAQFDELLRRVGDNPRLRAHLENRLGAAHLRRGDVALADAHFRLALASFEKVEGAESSRADVLANLGELSRRRGDQKTALELARQVVALRGTHMGSQSPSYAAALRNLGAVHADASRFQEAAEAFAAALDIEERALPPGHPALLRSRRNLGLIRVRQGQAEAGLALLLAGVEARDGGFAPDPHSQLATDVNLAEAYDALDRHEDALAASQRALERASTLPTGHPLLAPALVRHATSLRHLGRLAEAKGLLDRASSLATAAAPELRGELDLERAAWLLERGQALAAKAMLEKTAATAEHQGQGHILLRAEHLLSLALAKGSPAERQRARELFERAQQRALDLGAARPTRPQNL